MIHACALRRWGLLAPLLIATTYPAQADKENVRNLTAAYNASGQVLYQDIARSSGNIVFSPYLIGVAMAMVRSGARGDTEREMAALLNHPLSLGEIGTANAALIATLAGYDRAAQPDYCPKGAQWTGKHCEAPPSSDAAAPRRCPKAMQLAGDVCVGLPVKSSAKVLAANALLLTKHGHVISDEYKAIVRDTYAAAIYDASRLDEVNAWAKQKTEGSIHQVIGSPDRDAGVVLLSAAYLKAAWASPFTETRDGDFMLSTSQTVRLAMVRQQTPFALVERTAYRAIRLDYSERSLGMIIVLPTDVDGLLTVMRELDAHKLANLVTALKRAPRRVLALAIPRFKAALNADLVPQFKTVGMTLPFSDDADFGGMIGKATREGGLKIGAIRHLAAIEVTESGSGAAERGAAFYVPRMEGSFIVDRPFLFYVVDDTSGAVLFQGRVVDPRQ